MQGLGGAGEARLPGGMTCTGECQSSSCDPERSFLRQDDMQELDGAGEAGLPAG